MIFIFFFNDTATTEIYTLSLHDALPISSTRPCVWDTGSGTALWRWPTAWDSTRSWWPWNVSSGRDRKSTRLNSSHVRISYAVFCLKKKINHCPNYVTIHISQLPHAHPCH